MAEAESDLDKERFEAINRLLEQEYVLVHLNTGAQDLSIPDNLRANPIVTLKLSRWFRGAMEVSENQISAELLFNGKYFSCLIPLRSIWGATSAKGENLIWPAAVPPGIMQSLSALQAAPAMTESAKIAPEPQPAPKSPGKKQKPHGHLRRVK